MKYFFVLTGATYLVALIVQALAFAASLKKTKALEKTAHDAGLLTPQEV